MKHAGVEDDVAFGKFMRYSLLACLGIGLFISVATFCAIVKGLEYAIRQFNL